MADLKSIAELLDLHHRETKQQVMKRLGNF